MVTVDLLQNGVSLPSVYFQLDISMIASDEETSEVISTLLKNFSIGHKRDENTFHIHVQKVTLNGENLLSVMALLTDDDVQVTPKVQLKHMGERRFHVYLQNIGEGKAHKGSEG